MNFINPDSRSFSEGALHFTRRIKGCSHILTLSTGWCISTHAIKIESEMVWSKKLEADDIPSVRWNHGIDQCHQVWSHDLWLVLPSGRTLKWRFWEKLVIKVQVDPSFHRRHHSAYIIAESAAAHCLEGSRQLVLKINYGGNCSQIKRFTGIIKLGGLFCLLCSLRSNIQQAKKFVQEQYAFIIDQLFVEIGVDVDVENQSQNTVEFA